MATALLDEGWYHAELTLLDPEGGAISSALRSDGFYVVHDRSIVVAAVDFAGCPPILPVAVGLCDGGGIVELRDATGCVVEYACAADVAPTTRR